MTRLLSSILFGVTPTDPATFAEVVSALLVVLLLASYLPARRAASVDPQVATQGWLKRLCRHIGRGERNWLTPGRGAGLMVACQGRAGTPGAVGSR